MRTTILAYVIASMGFVMIAVGLLQFLADQVGRSADLS